mgnify:FL=1
MKRWWIWALTAAGVVAMIVLGASVLSQRHADSPERSLEALASATAARDWHAVETYIDVRAVATAVATANINAAMGIATDGDAAGTSASPHDDPRGSTASGEEALGGMGETYVENYYRAIQRSVEAGVPDDATGVEGVLVAGAASRIEYTTDDEARVTIDVPDEDGGTLEIFATMVRVDDHWQIIALETAEDATLPAE